MITVGGVMSGYCATGNTRYAMIPASTMMMEITIATIGRLMKNLDMLRCVDVCR